MADSATNVLKQQLREWLERVEAAVQNGTLTSEKDLEYYVRVHSEQDRDLVKARFNGIIPPSLFELLGYTQQTCDDHPQLPVQYGGSSKNKWIPDYIFCGTSKQDFLTWDLKIVSAPLSNIGFAGQVQSYCCHPSRPTPLGVLFNGFSLRVFINPDYYKLKQYQLEALKQKHGKSWSLDFKTSPVITVNKDDHESWKHLIDNLVLLSFSALSANAVNFASRLAKSAIQGEIGKGIQLKIVANIQNALVNPTDKIIEAVAGAMDSWEGLDNNPQTDQAVRAWARRHEFAASKKTASLTAGTSANKKLSLANVIREKVAEICALKGWNYIVKAKINGLRYNDVGGHGFVLVPQTQGVPANLYIADLAADNSIKVIKRLDDLLLTIVPSHPAAAIQSANGASVPTPTGASSNSDSKSVG